MKLIVKNNVGETVSIQIKSNETFIDLKERVEEEAGISLDLKDIALKGRKIAEHQRVMEYFLSYNEEPEEEQAVNIYCAVPGCKNTKATNPDIVFFEFPTEEIRCHQWVLYCQRLNAGPGKKRLSLTSESTICSDHFRPDQFVKNTHTLLKRTAVPSVKMVPSRDPLQIINKSTENLSSTEVSDLDTRNYFSEESQDTKDELRLQLRLCRLCSNACDDYILIFDDSGREMKIAEKINLCLPVEVHMTDALPKQICRECFFQVNQLYELADMVSLSQQKLKHLSEEDDEESTNNDDLALISLDETGEEVILGSSDSNKDENKDLSNGCCPLCKDGKMALSSKKNSTNKPSVLPSFSDIDCVNFVNNSSDPKKVNSQVLYDTDIDTGVDCSSSEDFTKESVLKLDDNSKSDNDQINECYSSLTSLNIMTPEDSCLKNIPENALSPINEELGNDMYPLDTESEHSLNLPAASDISFNKNTLSCRICGMEFNTNYLAKHCLSHSFKGFYQCVACISIFSSKEDLNTHILSHDDEDVNTIYCDVCMKSFKSAVSLASHNCNQDQSPSNHKKNSKGGSRNFSKSADGCVCDLCDKVFTDEIKLQKHKMFIHTNKKALCCGECGKVFKSEASMNYHQRTHQNDDTVRPYTCERCGKSFIRKSMLMNHMTSSHKHVAHETSCFTCKICYEAFPTTAAAVIHMDNHHKIECMDESTYSFEMHTITRLYICEFCERCYAEGSVLNQHREQHPSDSPYECRFCEQTFPTAEEVSQHRTEHLREEIPTEYLSRFNIPKTYLCEYCERCFLNQVKYTEHLTVHYGPEPYQCRHCTLKFASLLEAIEHRAIHADSGSNNDEYNFYRPYECHYCSKTFAIEDALVKHIRMHTGEKPFICNQCGKGFSQSSGLYTHQKVHSSERPYSCTVCPRTFKIKGDRDVHVRKHSGDRPYKCEFCGKAFMTQHVYSQHRKIHTGERPYKCDVCGIAFRRSHVLTVHKRIHTGEKPNICDICGKRYRQKGDMLKHRRIQHGIVTTKAINQLLL